MYTDAGNDFELAAANEMSLVSAFDAKVISTGGNLLLSAPFGTLTLDAANINLGGSGSGGLVCKMDVNIGSISNNVNVTSGLDFTAKAGRDVLIASSNEIAATASNDIAFASLAGDFLAAAATAI